jgi:hypothetical protein
VDEADVHAELDLLDRLGLGQVRADPPVLLGRVEDLVVDPAAARGLQQRVVQEEDEPAAGAQHPRHLGDRPSTSSMCSKTRQATAASNARRRNGSASAAART